MAHAESGASLASLGDDVSDDDVFAPEEGPDPFAPEKTHEWRGQIVRDLFGAHVGEAVRTRRCGSRPRRASGRVLKTRAPLARNVRNTRPPSAGVERRPKPSSEYIDAGDYSCAVEKDMLLHGRLYVTSSHLCFYCNIFGFEKRIKIPHALITSISREYTATFIPNALAVFTAEKKYVFRSFWDRDDCFTLLQTFESAFDRTPVVDALLREPGADSGRVSETGPPTPTPPARTKSAEPPVGATDDSLEAQRRRRLATTLRECDLPVDVPGFAEHFLDDNAGFGLAAFHAGQGDEEISATPWDAGDGRALRFRRRLTNPIGPSSTRTTKIQRRRDFGDEGLVMQSIMSMEDIPYRDCFTIHERWVVSRRGRGVHVAFEFEVKWSAPTIWKRSIEANSRRDLEAYYAAYEAQATAYLLARAVGGEPPRLRPAPSAARARPPWPLVVLLLCVLYSERSARAEVGRLRDEVARLEGSAERA